MMDMIERIKELDSRYLESDFHLTRFLKNKDLKAYDMYMRSKKSYESLRDSKNGLPNNNPRARGGEGG